MEIVFLIKKMEKERDKGNKMKRGVIVNISVVLMRLENGVEIKKIRKIEIDREKIGELEIKELGIKERWEIGEEKKIKIMKVMIILDRKKEGGSVEIEIERSIGSKK